ncbi:MAG: MBL fold metallo-hydrolase [Thermovirgaceae bacterium]|jgi:glyoxylase-like metal-dependent hydrolase (beta-lactamase superfamily II)|nr:MBL fold metallo-hydrolase [Synergistales bacterium]MDY0179144.1 MBL fold metallo-hydrolase [Synergistaceae bacterium]HPE91592.1 MBL fold metallo-hydrolase [Synergistales bacterium]
MTVKILDLKITPGVSVSLIDLPLDLDGYHDFFGIWLVRDEGRERNTLVDVGPTSTASILIEELHTLDVKKLDYILLTHIHLDHSGGLAELLRAFPSARVAVHPKGKRHLVNPERLWESSLQVIPEMALAYGEPSPVDESCFIPEEVPVPGITAVDTPGHAPHHRSFFYWTPEGQVLFAGEAASTFTRLDHLVPGAGERRYMLRPASPPRFYIETALRSIEELKGIDASLLCYAHFGCTEQVREMLDHAGEQIRLWRKLFSEFLNMKGYKFENQVEMGELLGFVVERDPWLADFSLLPADVRSREMRFMLSSAAGFLGAVLEERKV